MDEDGVPGHRAPPWLHGFGRFEVGQVRVLKTNKVINLCLFTLSAC